MALILELILALVVISLALYYYLTFNYNFWQRLGVSGPRPRLPFGTIGSILLNKHNLGTYLQQIYNTYKPAKLVGVFKLGEPILVVNDLDLIKDVLIKDFSKFVDRGMEIHEEHEPLSVHLFNLEPRRWRQLRAKLSPIFTSGKLKDMFYLLVECADQMGKYLDRLGDGEIVDMREIPARYATDVIGVCAFGLQTNAIEDEDSLFRQMGRRIFDLNVKNVTKFVMGFFLPTAYKLVGYFTRDNTVDNFIIGITKDTMDHRRQTKIVRKDFIDLLIGLKDARSARDDIELTDRLLAAQLFVFFAAGFETSATTIGNALFELAMDQSIQSKLKQEIDAELTRTNGKITYDGIKDMKYLDKVIHETLRKYPPLPFLARRSVVPYTFAGTGVTIPANTRVWIPIYGIQKDPEHFCNPDIFDPDRFSEENRKQRHDMTFLSFGDGPRNCIGARFGIMQTKVGLVKILQNRTVKVCEKTDLKYEINTRAFLLVPKNGVYVKVETH